ncbi:hypothetical protein RCG19_00590 [Neobacillus sp. OS1-2]|uniref:hypothetical protein n=1 Tax=Neobacillus sp. OS1-2 TaxID=3070680 RepID=UPI0027E016F8|nr:hypothetical protein [Neobacillus sp. OS1-2]WML40218.1 hypothetical protein RCG19_00590 [Neobacillus sp. OS1-2]
MKRAASFIVFIHFLLYGQGVQAKADISYKIEMLNWKEVNQLVPKYTKFTVMDVETGKRFKVQRRAGSHHADVQPLTAKDTKMMKKIYSGKWSWKRRAIIVIYKENWIAASMHGMPHGGGALQNNFPGHFCIHFYGSTTHRTNSMDLSHMLMVLKASGKLDDYLGKANPYEVINAYVAGFKQQDVRITSQASLQKVRWKPILQKVENVRLSRLELLPPEDLKEEISLDVPAVVDWYIEDRGRQTFSGDIHLVRFSPTDPWKVDSEDFLKENHLP